MSDLNVQKIQNLGNYLQIYKDDKKKPIATILFFENGFGASIIRNSMSYGNEKGLFELAVLKETTYSPVGEICYDTPITDDVLGELPVEKVIETLQQISHL